VSDASSESSHWRWRDFGAMLAGLAIVLVYLAASYVFAAALGQLLAGPWAALEQAMSRMPLPLSSSLVVSGVRLLVAAPLWLVGQRFASRFPARSVATFLVWMPVFAVAAGILRNTAASRPLTPQEWVAVLASAVLLYVGVWVAMRAEGVGWRRS
jgi:hypothetical protein